MIDALTVIKSNPPVATNNPNVFAPNTKAVVNDKMMRSILYARILCQKFLGQPFLRSRMIKKANPIEIRGAKNHIPITLKTKV